MRDEEEKRYAVGGVVRAHAVAGFCHYVMREISLHFGRSAREGRGCPRRPLLLILCHIPTSCARGSSKLRVAVCDAPLSMSALLADGKPPLTPQSSIHEKLDNEKQGTFPLCFVMFTVAWHPPG